MRIALIGTRGVPARYGGFETAVEEVGRRLVAQGHEVVVFCRGDAERPATYLGMELVHLPAAKQRALETLSHTALSVVHPALRGVEAAILFNAANAPLLPILRARGIPTACHVDGLEWRRAKWGPIGKKYYRVAESLAVRWADALIADAPGIADYYDAEFGAETVQIAYGAPILTDLGSEKLAEIGLTPGGYHLVVARAEPENHVLEIVQGYVSSAAKKPLVVVGSAPYADEYLAQIEAAADQRVQLLGSVWDQELLDQLYGNSLSYLHGHSVGGTNPSLLRAAGAGAFPIAFEVSFNRDIVGESGEYFATPEDVARQVVAAESDPAGCRARGQAWQTAIQVYNWDDVADRYQALCLELATLGPRRDRPSGRRAGNPRQPRRILVAHAGAELYGSDRVLLETVSAFVAGGATVQATVPTDGPLVAELVARGAEVEVLPVPVLRKAVLSPLGLLRFAIQAVRAANRQRELVAAADLVFVNTITIPTWIPVAKIAGRPVLVHVHEAERSQSLGVRRLLNLPLLGADWLFINSRFALEVLAESWPSLRRKATVVYNGVPGPGAVSLPRAEVDEPRLLFLGRLSPRKGPQVVIEALAELPNVRLQLLGDVFVGYEWFAEELRARVAELGLSDRVEFLGFDGDIWPYLADSDIVVIPSVAAEPFGNTAVEAILAQRPVVVSEIGGLPEAVGRRPGQELPASVRLVRPDDSAALAAAVKSLLAKWEAVGRAVGPARAAALNRLSPEAYQRAIRELIMGGSHG